MLEPDDPHEEWIYALESAPTAGWRRPDPQHIGAGRDGLPAAVVRRLVRRLMLLSDALLMALTQRSGRTSGESLRVVLSPRSRHFDRPAAALQLLDKLLPGVARGCGKLALDTRRIPLAASELALLDYGGGETVYTLDTASGPLVCKVQRASLGRPLAELVALAAQRRKGYSAVLDHYRGVRECFPPAHFLVMHGPILGVPAVISLQAFVEGSKRDLLRDCDDAMLARLFAEDPGFRDQVVRFLKRTLVAWEEGEWIVDLGEGNLLLNEGPDGPRLVYTDVQMKKVARLKPRTREVVYQPAMERMREILLLARRRRCP